MRVRTTVLLVAAALAAGCGGNEGTGADEGYAGRMAAEHRDDSPVASEAAVAEPSLPVVGREVVYGEMDGTQLGGYLAKPAEGYENPPALIVIHEWWGLNDNIRAMTRRLAGEGYRALAVDLYGGATAEDPDGARELMTRAMENPDRMMAVLRRAAEFLRADHGAPRIGVIGWCFGGGVALQAALAMPERIDAVVMYYGRVVTDPARLEALHAPLLGLFGEADQGIPVESVREFESALGELGKQAEIRIYPGAGHAFANPSGTRYNAPAAEDAWTRAVAFFGRHLKG